MERRGGAGLSGYGTRADRAAQIKGAIDFYEKRGWDWIQVVAYMADRAIREVGVEYRVRGEKSALAGRQEKGQK